MADLQQGPTLAEPAPTSLLNSALSASSGPDLGMQWPILISCCLASCATLLQPPLWVFDPPGVQPFDAAWSDFRLFASVSGVLQIAFLLVGGVWGDFHGRRRVWLIGLVGFIFAHLLLMISPLPGWHIPVRFLALAFGSIFAPLALGTLNYTYTDDRRAMAFAIYVIINAGAVQLAWLQGQFLFEWLGWRSTYILPVLFGVLALRWVYRYILETRTGQHRRLDILVQSGMALLILAVIYGIAVLPVAADHWMLVVGAAVVVGLAGAVLVVWWNLNSPKEQLRRSSFRARDLTALIVTGAVLNFMLIGFGLRTLSMFQVVRSMSVFVAVLAFAPVLLGLVAALYIFLKAMHKYQARAVIASGMGVMGLAMAIAAMLPMDAPYWAFAVSLFLFGLGYLVASTVWTSAFFRTTVARYHGVTAAISRATSVIGGAIGSALTGNLLSQLGLDLYLERMLAADVNISKAFEALVGFKTLVLSDPVDIADVTEHFRLELVTDYREVYAIAYSQILWLMVAFCLVAALIIALGLRSSLRATITVPTDEELSTS